eukprot:7013543-Pyramimonas_sp.AAC.1
MKLDLHSPQPVVSGGGGQGEVMVQILTARIGKSRLLDACQLNVMRVEEVLNVVRASGDALADAA